MRTKFKDIADKVTEAEFKEFVGENAYKFSLARERALDSKKTAPAWMCLLFGPVYGVYYKHWDAFFGFILIAMLVAVTGDDLDNNTIIGTAGLLCGVYCYYRLKIDYVHGAYKKIHKLKQVEDDDERLKRLLRKRGGTSKLNVVIAIAVLIFLSLMTASTSQRAEMFQSIEQAQIEMEDY
ncbi:MAG: hypothetical protein NZ828_11935 [Alphaproteobacteria bacterium]|nr:hypothetical protein [Alphaproteobacteria bacterium]